MAYGALFGAVTAGVAYGGYKAFDTALGANITSDPIISDAVATSSSADGAEYASASFRSGGWYSRLLGALRIDAQVWGKTIVVSPQAMRYSALELTALVGHELVHVSQWGQYGHASFLWRYGTGCLAAWSCTSNALESGGYATQRLLLGR
jgi:hypothetical protein